jgi:hypothetical protein
MKVKSERDFIEIDVTKEMMDEAMERMRIAHAKHGDGGTYRLDKKNQKKTGYLAETAAKYAFSKLKYYENELGESEKYDLIGKNNVTFDVKACGCNSKPRVEYVGNVYTSQKCLSDIFIFSRVKNDFTKVWITGFIGRQEYQKESKIMKKGHDGANFQYEEPRYEMKYKDMFSPKLLLG